MTNITDIGAFRVERVTDNKALRPADILRAALTDIESGAEAPQRMMILHWSEHDENGFSTNWYSANLHSTEMLALMEMVKATLLRDMGLT